MTDTLRNHLPRYFLLFFAYLVCWLLPRFPAVFSNVLSLDDFWLGVANWGGAVGVPNQCPFPAPDFRWLGFLIICIQSKILPDWLLTAGPKIVAGCAVAFAGVLNYRILKRWRLSGGIAALLPLVWIFHPVLNEITLWNTTYLFGFSIALAFLAFYIWNRSASGPRIWIAAAILVFPVLAYEIYATVFLVLVLSDLVFQRISGEQIELRRSLTGISIFAGVAVLYLLVVFATITIFGPPPGRGLIAPELNAAFISEKLHGVANLLANVFMPVVGYHAGIEKAWSAWKWTPIALVVAIFLLVWWRRRAIFEAGMLAAAVTFLMVLPTLWVFASSQSPESWRTSAPALFAASLALAVMLMLLPRPRGLTKPHSVVGTILSLGVLISVIAAEIPVTYAEARLRVEENRLDKEIVEYLISYWAEDQGADFGFSVGVIVRSGIQAPQLSRAARDITRSYRSRGYVSAFDYEFSWRGFLAHKSIDVAEIDARESLHFHQQIVEGCKQQKHACRLDLFDTLYAKCRQKPDFVQKETGARVAHLVDEHVSVVCH